MKKFMLLAAFAAAALSANAQLSFGINAGYDNVAMTLKEDSHKETTNLNGFHVGPTIHYSFSQVKGLGIGGGLYYQFAAKKDNDRKEALELLGVKNAKASEQLHNIQIPVRVSYNYDFNSDWGVFGFAGPQLNFGLFSGSKASGKLNDETYKSSYNGFTGKSVTKIGSDKDTQDNDKSIRMFDLMFGLGAGVHYQNLYLTIGYDFGLVNRVADKDARKDFKLHQNQLQVSLGYNF